MEKTDIIAIFEAIKVCKMYNEEDVADKLIDILDEHASADPSENVPEKMTEAHADIIGEAINVCDRLGEYGAGDNLFDVINNHYRIKVYED